MQSSSGYFQRALLYGSTKGRRSTITIDSNIDVTTAHEAAWIGLGLLVFLAPLVALAFRRLRIPAALLIGGTVVGLALGPSLFGRIAPVTYVQLFEGSPSKLEQVFRADRAIRAMTIAAGSRMSAPDAADQEQLVLAREEASAKWDAERRVHTRPFAIAAIACAGLVLATSLGFGARPRPLSLNDAVLALWSFVPAALAALLVAVLLGDALLTPATAILVCACACGAWRVSREERVICRSTIVTGARETSRTTAATARVVTLFACAVAIPALWFSGHVLLGPGAAVALGIGAIIGFLPRPRRASRLVGAIAIPILAAFVAVRVDPTRDVSLLLLVGLFLIAEDARWLGAFVGRTLGGEPPMSAMRTAMAGLAVGPTMLVFTALGSTLGILTGLIALSLLFAAILVEFLAPARLRVAKRLEAAGTPIESDR